MAIEIKKEKGEFKNLKLKIVEVYLGFLAWGF